MSPKDFRKINHPQPELKVDEVSGDRPMMNEQTNDKQTNKASPRVDPPGGSTENCPLYLKSIEGNSM